MHPSEECLLERWDECRAYLHIDALTGQRFGCRLDHNMLACAADGTLARLPGSLFHSAAWRMRWLAAPAHHFMLGWLDDRTTADIIDATHHCVVLRLTAATLA